MDMARAVGQDIPHGASGFGVLGERLYAHPSGALWWPARQLLAVADLHLEKGSSYARKGIFLPPYDSRATLRRLAGVVHALKPAFIIALGDSFHDEGGPVRLGAQEREALEELQADRRWIWVLGNHDPALPGDLGGQICAEIQIGALTFRHKPKTGAEGEVAGHLHPCAKLRASAHSVRRPCFIEDGKRVVLPAFGAFTGGLNVWEEAFCPLFERQTKSVLHVLGRRRVYAVCRSKALRDAKAG